MEKRHAKYWMPGGVKLFLFFVSGRYAEIFSPVD